MITGRVGFLFFIVSLLGWGPVSPIFAAEDILGADACVIARQFDADWRIYSDFDTRLPLQSRSWAVQEHEAAQAEIRKINEEIALLSAHMELDRLARLEARALEQALTQNIKANLLRAFWRLAWITYNTIGGPTGKTGMVSTGRSYAELFTEEISVASVGSILDIAKKLVPKQYSKLPGAEGRVINVGVDAVLETMKNTGKSPVEMAAGAVKTLMETGGDEVLDANSTSPDISPEEIAILRSQYLDKNGLKDAIAASYELNIQRMDRIAELEVQARTAAEKATEWERTEKQRVYASLNKYCRKGPELQFSLITPKSVTAGEVAEVFVQLPPGREESEFSYGWVHDEEFLLKNSLSAQFQSMRLGPHRVSVQFFDREDNRNLGMLNASIEVVAPQTATMDAATASGQSRVRVSRLTIEPILLKPGEIVEVEVEYLVSGLPQGRKVPVTLRITGQGFDETSQGEVVNGSFTGWYRLPTVRWKPGRYTVNATVSVPGASASLGGEFVLRQPDVAVMMPPALSTPSPVTSAGDFVGDWTGTGTVINTGVIEGWARGDRLPVKIRITREGGAYRVYDLLEPDMPNAPMNSRVEGDSVVFFYQGPAIDTEGYKHPETPIDVSWTLSLAGNTLSGNYDLLMEGENVTVQVQATRAR